ncbi:hypothetical protein C7C45_28180 [Micromonospora arborensis]|uniref:Uncharacterized protein n=1 Tax=Micromonospora arborensis TaxID=2116518 RepID=A0A318NVA0_9ACTN|nr:hypothetical protein C7C45_28180 [Micromonospora arborensis]
MLCGGVAGRSRPGARRGFQRCERLSYQRVDEPEDQGVNQLSLPWGQMLAYLVGAVVVGLTASIAPARHGARLDVLAAINHV